MARAKFSPADSTANRCFPSASGSVGKRNPLSIVAPCPNLNSPYPLLSDSSKAEITYLATFMLSDAFDNSIRGFCERASIPKINRSQLFSVRIHLTPLVTQQAIVAEIEAEPALVAANRELVTRFEQKIQASLARIWGGKTPAVSPEP